MTYEIYWDDLNMDAQIRLQSMYHDNIGISPLAIIEIEDEEPDTPMSRVTLFYRDGANYKSTATFIVGNKLLETAEQVHMGRSIISEQFDDPFIRYDVDLGISREEFHAAIGWPYTDEHDHNFVSIEKIEEL